MDKVGETLTTLTKVDPGVLILLIIMIIALGLGMIVVTAQLIAKGQNKETEAEAADKAAGAKALTTLADLLTIEKETQARRESLYQKQVETLTTITASLNQITQSQLEGRTADEKKTGEIIAMLSDLGVKLTGNMEEATQDRQHFKNLGEDITRRLEDMPTRLYRAVAPAIQDFESMRGMFQALKETINLNSTRDGAVTNALLALDKRLTLIHDDLLSRINLIARTQVITDGLTNGLPPDLIKGDKLEKGIENHDS